MQPPTAACRDKVAEAMHHCGILVLEYPPVLTVRCMSLPAVREAMAQMNSACDAGDFLATTAAAKQYYRVLRAALVAEQRKDAA